MRWFLSVGLMAWMLVVSASASEIDPAQVPADAKWIIHLNLDALRTTRLAEQIRQKNPEAVEKMQQWLGDQYGIDPREDLHGLLLFGTSYKEHTGVMVLEADFDADKATAKITAQPDVKKEEWQGHTLYTLTIQKGSGMAGHHHGGPAHHGAASKEGEGEATAEEGAATEHRAHGHTARGDSSTASVTIVLVDGRHAVFASSPDLARLAVERLESKEETDRRPPAGLIEDVPKGTILYGAAVDLGQIAERKGPFPILQQHERINYAAGVDNEEVFEMLKLVAKSPEVAEQMAKVLEGCVALLQVWAADSPHLSRITREAEIKQEGITVRARFRAKSEDVLGALEEVKQRAIQMHHAEATSENGS